MKHFGRVCFCSCGHGRECGGIFVDFVAFVAFVAFVVFVVFVIFVVSVVKSR